MKLPSFRSVGVAAVLTTAAIACTPRPVHAGGFYPHAAARIFCELRRMGMQRDPAIYAAIQRTWSEARSPAVVYRNGQRFTEDVLQFADSARIRCPHLMAPSAGESQFL